MSDIACQEKSTASRRFHRKHIQQPFRLLDLPRELREEIYHQCLVNETPCIILHKFHKTTWGKPLTLADIYDNDKDVELTTWGKVSITVNLVLVNKFVHSEAVPILYGSNVFRFNPGQPWEMELICFHHRLRCISRQNLRNIKILLPNILREKDVAGAIISRFTPVGNYEMCHIIPSLPSLKHLTIHVYNDLLNSDTDVLQSIYASLERRCRVSLKICKPQGYLGKDLLVRIGSLLVAKVHEWEWELSGEYDLIDEQHPLSNETKWLEDLKIH